MTSYLKALEPGKPIPTKIMLTLIDGLAVPMVGTHIFEVVRHYIDKCMTCNKKEVSLAIFQFIKNEKMVLEGGATGLVELLPRAKLDR